MAKKKEKAFTNWRNGAFYLVFPNGNKISTTFAVGSYSENHNAPLPPRNEFVKMESNTCEVMVDCPEKLSKRLHKKYGGDGSVIGYLGINQWTEIVVALSK